MKKPSFKFWVSVVTLALVIIIIVAARRELVHAWHLLGRVDMLTLALIVPITLVGYLASGEMIFSYLRQKGDTKNVNPFSLMRLSLELNFVNHALPSGGISGVSYANWRLAKYGVSVGRATIAQAVRYVVGFVAIALYLVVAVVMITIDGTVNRWIILMSSMLIFGIALLMIVGIYLLHDVRRLRRFSEWLSNTLNRFGRKVLRRRGNIVDHNTLLKFFDDIHADFVVLKKERRLLIQPFLWSLLFTAMEICLFWVAFRALGAVVNPASLLIAYGLASFAGFIVITPGGIGAYEAIVIAILTFSGISQEQAIAGTVLYRMIVLSTTIIFGYIFYQLTIMRYGRKNDSNAKRK